MSRTFITLSAFLALLCACGEGASPTNRSENGVVVPDAGVAMPRPLRIKVLVLPMECFAKKASYTQCDANLGLVATLAERLENDLGIEPVNGPLVLTAEQAALRPAPGTRLDLAAANTLAKEKGAAYFITGAVSGVTWAWTYEVSIYAVGDTATKAGTNANLAPDGHSRQLQGAAVVNMLRDGRKEVSASLMLAAYADALSAAFRSAGLPIEEGTLAEIARPDTKNAYAFLLLSRAYEAHFIGLPAPAEGEKRKEDEEEDTTLARARRAVKVDPAQWTAQRFYAHLMAEAGDLSNARIHYEEARKRRPDDLRTLIGLGTVEVADRNPEIGRRHLEKALSFDPDHARARHWLGAARIALGDRANGIREHERSRELDPAYAEPRRALIELYAEDRRYADAAVEAQALTDIAKEDPGAWYLLGANLRAAGKRADAADAYARGAMRFPDEKRLHLFRADILREDGKGAEARAAYLEASSMAWYNERLKAIIQRKKHWHLGGSELVEVIDQSALLLAQLDELRKDFDVGIADASFDLRDHGSEACKSGAGASSAEFGREAAIRFREIAEGLAADAWRIGVAWKNGEHRSLTTDEFVRGKKVRDTAWRYERDWREMRTEYRRTFLPLYIRADCASYDGEIETTTRARIMRRLESRTVELPEVLPPLYGMPISPNIPAQPAETVTFYVDNDGECATHDVWLDGIRLGEATKGIQTSWTVRKGLHTYCLVRPGGACGTVDAIRRSFVHNGLRITLRCGT